MSLAINPAWFSVAFTATGLFVLPLTLGLFKFWRALFKRLDVQDARQAASDIAAEEGRELVGDQLGALTTAQHAANGKVGKLQTDVAMLQGTVYGADAKRMVEAS